MNRTNILATAIAFALLFPIELPAQDLAMQSRIRQEGFRNSKVMELASGLTDTIGPRLTASPSMKRANDWTRQKLADFGLANAHLEPFAFGRGWTSESCVVRMIAPDVTQLYALPKAWSPGTNGPVRGKVMKVKLESEADLEKQKGKLAGAIVMMADPRPLDPHDKSMLERYDEKELEELAAYSIPSSRDNARLLEYVKRRKFRRALAQFTMDEKIAAIVDLGGGGDGGSFRIQSGGSWKKEDPIGVPQVVLAPEHYGRLARLIDAGIEVQLEVDVKAQFLDADTNGYNTIADLPGGDRKNEIVMLGAHLDSWHGSTGATDNAAGVAVMMEAIRILKALNVTPRRTIRIALWSGEEQGLLGSRAYVAEHFASRAEPKDPEERELPFSMRKEKTPLTVKPEHAKLSAYFNLDNGTGKIRGIYAQENAAAVPLFRTWLEPLHDLGATTVTMRNTSGTDHLPFDEVGLPGFQFIQDEVEYSTRTHHTNWDSYERLQREDLMQAAVVVATFVWEAANRAELMPRKVLPQ
ncbi:MAG TPA: M20/M25/M40 family metallo-hydrolase [Thermoanaerobaculia bacterium]